RIATTAGRLTLKRGESYSIFVKRVFLSTKENLFMRPGKKLITGLLPTFICLLAMLIVACGGPSTTTTTTHTKASADKQVFVSGVEEGNADLLSFDPALAPDFFSASAINMVFTGLVQ